MTKIRKATIEELQIIQNIGTQTYWTTYLPILGDKQIEYMLEQFYSLAALEKQVKEGHTFLICNHNNKDVAFASFNLSDPSSKAYHLQKLYILPEAQGCGLGRLLMESVIETCKKENGKLLNLNVNRFNNARSFYEKMGFSIKSSADIAIGNNYFMNDYIMELILN